MLCHAWRKSKGAALFKALAKAYGYREYDLHGYTKQWNKRNSPLSIGANISQKLASRAFAAAEEYRKSLRGKPRFKGYPSIQSIEDKNLEKGNLRLKDDAIHS